jgi:hypothetical protein
MGRILSDVGSVMHDVLCTVRHIPLPPHDFYLHDTKKMKSGHTLQLPFPGMGLHKTKTKKRRN